MNTECVEKSAPVHLLDLSTANMKSTIPDDQPIELMDVDGLSDVVLRGSRRSSRRPHSKIMVSCVNLFYIWRESLLIDIVTEDMTV